MKFTIQTAADSFSELLDLVKAGEEILIVDGTTPVAKIVPIIQNRFKIGLLRDKIGGKAPHFFEAMNEDQVRLWKDGA